MFVSKVPATSSPFGDASTCVTSQSVTPHSSKAKCGRRQLLTSDAKAMQTYIAKYPSKTNKALRRFRKAWVHPRKTRCTQTSAFSQSSKAAQQLLACEQSLLELRQKLSALESSCETRRYSNEPHCACVIC